MNAEFDPWPELVRAREALAEMRRLRERLSVYVAEHSALMTEMREKFGPAFGHPAKDSALAPQTEKLSPEVRAFFCAMGRKGGRNGKREAKVQAGLLGAAKRWKSTQPSSRGSTKQA